MLKKNIILKYIILILLVLIILISCDKEDKKDKEIEKETEKEDKTLSFTELDKYTAGPDEPSVTISLQHTATYKMNNYLGFPDGNTLKIHDVCYDEELNQGYAVGIMTSDIAVFKNDKMVDYYDSGLGYGLKKIYCGEGILFAATETAINKIDGKTGAILDTLTFTKIFIDGIAFNQETSMLLVPVPFKDVSKDVYKVYDTESMEEITTLELSQAFVGFTKENNIIAVEFHKDSYPVYIFDKDTFEKEEIAVLTGVRGATEAAYNKDNEEIWLLKDEADKVFVYELNNPEEKPVGINVVPEPTKLEYSNGYVVVVSENGFDDGTVGGYLGGVSIINADSKELLYELQIPHKHKELDISEKRIYLVNNDDNSIESIDIATGKQRTIDVGSSVEYGTVVDDRSIFLTNRLGGSTLFHFNPKTEVFTEIASGQWPVGIAYSARLNKVFTFDFLSSSISVIDPDSNTPIDSFSLNVAEGETDGIGDMVFDNTRDILYALIPEQNLVVIADASGTVLKVLDLVDYGADYSKLQGAGTLTAGIYEPTATLFVYAQEAEKLFIYNGLDDFAFVTSIYVPFESAIRNYPYSLFVDNYHDKAYIGNIIIDAKTYKPLGTLSYGDSVVAVDNEHGFMLTAGVDRKGQERLYALTFSGDLVEQGFLNKDQEINARFVYDDDDGKLYALYMQDAEVWEYSVY